MNKIQNNSMQNSNIHSSNMQNNNKQDNKIQNNNNKQDNKKPRIAVTMGDPAGIGPEITLKAILDEEVYNKALVVVIGNSSVLSLIGEKLALKVQINVVDRAEDAIDKYGVFNLIDIDNIDMDTYRIGQVSGMCGKAAFDYIKRGVEMTMAGDFDAIATGPINKESLAAGEIPYIGHTEIFADLTSTDDPLTMFETNNMRIFFLTRHVALSEVPGLITKDRIISYVKSCFQALDRLGVTRGTMAIAGLNPHSGEHGLFGLEEVKEIEPAVDYLKSQGYDVAGPIGADSVFHQCLIGKYNSVLSLYHDQGHIAAKTLDFHRTISITNGMPILRTSVDHGTAFDIAGEGLASQISMVEAILLAAKYSDNFNR